MGIFNKIATSLTPNPSDVELAYESKQSTGLCLVLGEKRNRETPLSNYAEHKPALRKIVDNNQKHDDETVVVPVVIRFDEASSYKDSIGVYFGKVQVGWIPKGEAAQFVDMLKADGRKGVGILGELFLDRGDINNQVIFHELYVYA